MGQLSMHSPHGDLTIFDDDEGNIIVLEWGWAMEQIKTKSLSEAKRQLDQYFDGELKNFNLPLKPHGTPLQRKIWSEMNNIPYGKTITYGELAKKVGTVARAAGNACGANPIPIIQPCHRILGANGKMTGYSGEGGTQTKEALLALEGNRPIFDFY